MPLALPAHPDLDRLKKTAKKRLMALRANKPNARLYEAQRALANAYGFKSWRHAEGADRDAQCVFTCRDRVFDAARAGDIETIRRAFAGGFDPVKPLFGSGQGDQAAWRRS